VNYYVHDRWLRQNPPLAESMAGTLSETNPYLYQYHLFDKTQPENLDFLKRFRALLDKFGARASVGEVGDEWRSLQTVAAYTEGGERLHMCYTFHDVMRHVSRWTATGGDLDATAKFSIALLGALRGSICLYQGEELGLPEAELSFEELRDPYGIRFWPAFKGRDGCRTPMVWEASKPNGGFSTGKPWLPVPENHLARAADTQNADPNSVLCHYRRALAFRREHPALVGGAIAFLDATDDILALTRTLDGETLLCVFNFSPQPAAWPLPAEIGAMLPLDAPGNGQIGEGEIALPGLGFIFARLG
jgi:alpha-glucosidase